MAMHFAKGIYRRRNISFTIMAVDLLLYDQSGNSLCTTFTTNKISSPLDMLLECDLHYMVECD